MTYDKEVVALAHGMPLPIASESEGVSAAPYLLTWRGLPPRRVGRHLPPLGET